jgi:hypothetical protein
MTRKLQTLNRKQAGYLAGYSALLLFSLSGLMLQGDISLLVGVLCWFSIVIGLFIGYAYNFHSKMLRWARA